MQDSNLRPLAPKASAMPDYANSHFVIGPGLEPKLIESKSIVLTNYTIRQFERVTGFEPATSYLEGTHSTNWATPAYLVFSLPLNNHIAIPVLLPDAYHISMEWLSHCAFWELRYPGPIINSDVLYLWAKKAYIQKNP